MANKNVPQIRFKGFDGEWEEKRLGEIMTGFEYGLNASAKPFDGENKYLRITDIEENSRNFDNSDLTSPNCDLTYCDSYLLKKGDICFARTGASVGKTYSYKESDGKVYFAGFLIKASNNSNCDSEFVFQNTLTKGYLDYIRITSQRSGQPGVNAQEFASYCMKLPNVLSEQTCIASLFTSLDKQISTQEQKIEKLKAIKKTLLKKMFASTGEKTPEIRFKGFDGEWEEKKLGDIASRLTRKNSNNECDLPLTIASQYGLIDQREYFNSRVASSNVTNYFLLKRGEFAYNKSTSDGFPWGSIKRLDRYPMGVLSTLYIIFDLKKDSVVSDYVVTYYSTKNWYDSVKSIAAEGARNHGLLNISPIDFFTTKIQLPQNQQEQTLIANLFTALDKQISCQEQKIEKLKAVKKTLLKKMFV